MSDILSKRRRAVRERPSAMHDAALEKAVLAFRMRRPDEAERLAREGLAANRGNLAAAQILGQALLLQNRPGEAIEPMRRAARRSHDPATETLLGRALAAAGRVDEALDQLRRTTARRPPFALAFLELGEQLGGLGRFEEAVVVFEDGMALAPDAAVLKVGLGYLHLKRNDRPRARCLFAQAHQAWPQRNDAVVGLATVTALDGDYAAAADLYRRALGLRPDDAMTRIGLGKCLLELGERDTGEATLRAATQGAPQLAGLAITALAATPRGRFFLRPSAVASFLGVAASA